MILLLPCDLWLTLMFCPFCVKQFCTCGFLKWWFSCYSFLPVHRSGRFSPSSFFPITFACPLPFPRPALKLLIVRALSPVETLTISVKKTVRRWWSQTEMRELHLVLLILLFCMKNILILPLISCLYTPSWRLSALHQFAESLHLLCSIAHL